MEHQTTAADTASHLDPDQDNGLIIANRRAKVPAARGKNVKTRLIETAIGSTCRAEN